MASEFHFVLFYSHSFVACYFKWLAIITLRTAHSSKMSLLFCLQFLIDTNYILTQDRTSPQRIRLLIPYKCRCDSVATLQWKAFGMRESMMAGRRALHLGSSSIQDLWLNVPKLPTEKRLTVAVLYSWSRESCSFINRYRQGWKPYKLLSIMSVTADILH